MSKAAILLAELVALPSVNPAFMPAGDPRAGEQRVADYIAAAALSARLDVEMQPVFPGRLNVLARLVPPQPATSRILLAPHLDTIGDATMPPEMFLPQVRDGRLHGRGACDTKGSVAAMLTALMEVAMSGRRPQQTEVVFAGLVDEEESQSGSRALARSGIQADLAIVGEPTELKIITAHKGDLWLKVRTHGTAAHGSKPHLGVNAIQAMIPILQWIKEEYAQELQKRKHPLLGAPTINIGSIHGGTQPNIVPDFCEISLDRRTVPAESDEFVLQEISKGIAPFGGELISSKGNSCLPMETDPNLPLVRQFFSLAGQEKPLGVDFFCDASILAASGIASIVFGPGSIAQAHTADEFIELTSLENGTDLLIRFLRSLP
ncbi:MAG: M20/M25/M40 family metallo-hydrolase [Verrucomicrobiota bacterium]|nr:M20/M25/M40 family metallo-hydrolase [Verrucomicrobiota bacterium]